MPLDFQTRRIIERLEDVTEGLIKDMVLDITSELIAKTPVKTGWARANWIPSVGDLPDGLAGARDDVDYSLQSIGIGEIASYDIADGPVWIVNGVPYILGLNAGSSPKAPSGFVDRAVEEGVKKYGGRKFV